MKQMKTLKTFVTLLLAVMMVTMMASVAFAADVGIKYKVVAFSSQNKDYPATNLEGDGSKFWHTEFDPTPENPPHWIVLDLQGEYNITELKYLPRQDNNNTNGHITEYNIYVSLDNKKFDKVANGTWDKSTNKVEDSAKFGAVKARYVKLEDVKDQFMAAQKITIIGSKAAAADTSAAKGTGSKASAASASTKAGASNPKTGDAGTMPYIVMALLSAAALVVTKKIRLNNK